MASFNAGVFEGQPCIHPLQETVLVCQFIQVLHISLLQAAVRGLPYVAGGRADAVLLAGLH